LSRDTNYSPTGEYLQLRLPLLRMQNGTKLHRWLLLSPPMLLLLLLLLLCCTGTKDAKQEDKSNAMSARRGDEQIEKERRGRIRSARTNIPRCRYTVGWVERDGGRGRGNMEIAGFATSARVHRRARAEATSAARGSNSDRNFVCSSVSRCSREIHGDAQRYNDIRIMRKTFVPPTVSSP